MIYVISDIKKLLRNKMVQISFLIMLILSIVSPISTYFSSTPDYIGAQPFQWWLLMGRDFGGQIYRKLFLAFPVLLTGLLFTTEKNTSMYEFLIMRKSRIQYLNAKLISTVGTSFFAFIIIFGINLVVTHICFSTTAPITEQYEYLVPCTGTFGDFFYQINPVACEIAYSILNALVIALLAGTTLSIQFVFCFKNKFIAFFAPFVTLNILWFAIGYLDQFGFSKYDLFLAVQPMVAAAESLTGSFFDVAVSLLVLALVNALLLIIGYRKLRDAL